MFCCSEPCCADGDDHSVQLIVRGDPWKSDTHPVRNPLAVNLRRTENQPALREEEPPESTPEVGAPAAVESLVLVQPPTTVEEAEDRLKQEIHNLNEAIKQQKALLQEFEAPKDVREEVKTANEAKEEAKPDEEVPKEDKESLARGESKQAKVTPLEEAKAAVEAPKQEARTAEDAEKKDGKPTPLEVAMLAEEIPQEDKLPEEVKPANPSDHTLNEKAKAVEDPIVTVVDEQAAENEASAAVANDPMTTAVDKSDSSLESQWRGNAARWEGDGPGHLKRNAKDVEAAAAPAENLMTAAADQEAAADEVSTGSDTKHLMMTAVDVEAAAAPAKDPVTTAADEQAAVDSEAQLKVQRDLMAQFEAQLSASERSLEAEPVADASKYQATAAEDAKEEAKPAEEVCQKKEHLTGLEEAKPGEEGSQEEKRLAPEEAEPALDASKEDAKATEAAKAAEDAKEDEEAVEVEEAAEEKEETNPIHDRPKPDVKPIVIVEIQPSEAPKEEEEKPADEAPKEKEEPREPVEEAPKEAKFEEYAPAEHPTMFHTRKEEEQLPGLVEAQLLTFPHSSLSSNSRKASKEEPDAALSTQTQEQETNPAEKALKEEKPKEESKPTEQDDVRQEGDSRPEAWCCGVSVKCCAVRADGEVLMSEYNVEQATTKIRWDVNVGMLGKTRVKRAPIFDVWLGRAGRPSEGVGDVPRPAGTAPFTLKLVPKTGFTFEESCGRGVVQLECEALLNMPTAASVTFSVMGQGSARMVSPHDFLEMGVCKLPVDQDAWDLQQAAASQTNLSSIAVEISLLSTGTETFEGGRLRGKDTTV